MPLPFEHAVRLHIPNWFEYKRVNGVKSYNGIKLRKPIDILYGRKKTDAKNHWTTQSLRFPIENWTKQQVDKFIKDNKIQYILYENASKTVKDMKFNKEEFMLKKLPIFKIVPKECDFLEIAVVDNPAIEEYFLKFSDDKEVIIEFSEDKQIIKGAVMIPEKLIYRNDSIGERFVTYDVDGIKLAAEYFLKNGFRFNDSHTKTKLDIQLLETFFADDNNEFNVPKGSWIVSAKVNDSELWNRLKEKESGFSFQSLFTNELIGTEVLEFNNNKNNNKKMTVKEKLLNFVDSLLFDEDVVEQEVKVEEVKEEFAAPIDTPSETPTEPTDDKSEDSVDYYSKEEVDAKFAELYSMIEELKSGVSQVDAKVEEFGKQPISQPIKESVEVVSTENRYAGFKIN